MAQAQRAMKTKVRVRLHITAGGAVFCEMTRERFGELFPEGGRARDLDEIGVEVNDVIDELDFEVDDAEIVPRKGRK